MKRNFCVMFLWTVAALTVSAQSVKELGSIRELREQADGTAVKLNAKCDTVMPTLDGGLCLSDGYRIRVEGSGLKSATIIKGQLTGIVTKDGNAKEGHSFPVLRVSEAESQYEVVVNMTWWYQVDLLTYEQNLAAASGEYVNPWAQIPTDPRPGIRTVKSIKELKKLESGTEARLMLYCDTVLFAKSGEIYIRDGASSAAICFRNSGLDLQEGMVLLGTVVGRLDVVDGTPQFVGTANTVPDYFIVTDQSPYTMPYIEGSGDVQDSYVDDVIVTGEVVIDSIADNSGARQLYVCMNDDSRLLLSDYYGFTQSPISVPSTCDGLRCILVWVDGHYVLYPLDNLGTDASPVGVAPVMHRQHPSVSSTYDLQGRRISRQPRQGIYIRDGRKVVVK